MSCNCKDWNDYEYKFDGQDSKNIDEPYSYKKYKKNTFSHLLYDMYCNAYAISKGIENNYAKLYP